MVHDKGFNWGLESNMVREFQGMPGQSFVSSIYPQT
ncbi:unnamed protein product [Fusarium graminearum]|uniref:Chromosome 1, complete genome n=1 Tax=Gibberella zeae (strain ATCC MYA-4620 / CBS 123657 / FGSC 9075 / NRRL 31084 / PH-1) TaxID=229533 RepID=I1S4H0_GIBZE|nr:hypothetical protein FGSG_11737 [Fusarium graminearum PH-1]ESU05428.1 hypothetical protein FGSG_11737 [Fusarium graminearum PH-1]CEF72164.1 unnamed protein product [Fusarium graminearum]CZS75426.1 unnamed protein product [Fusarium graminearum]|eukprot:XP_011315913.1 hypothetical protein FGSG_11737 [Fusarium graminearum PH-1]